VRPVHPRGARQLPAGLHPPVADPRRRAAAPRTQRRRHQDHGQSAPQALCKHVSLMRPATRATLRAMRAYLLVLVAGVSFAKTNPPAVKEPPRAHAPKAPVPLEEYFKIRRIGSRSGILLSFSYDE